MAFRYLRDPLFLFCVALYGINRLVLKPVFSAAFFHNNLNDLICISIWVPVMLWLMRKVGARPDDAPPRAHEIVLPLVVWSWVFEVWLPRAAAFSQVAHADVFDVLCYAAGTCLAAGFWKLWYRKARHKAAT